MANGRNEEYPVTTGEWMDMNKAITELSAITGQLRETTGKIEGHLSKMNNTLDGLPCATHNVKIENLEKRPSATKAVYVVGGIISLILAVYSLISIVGKG